MFRWLTIIAPITSTCDIQEVFEFFFDPSSLVLISTKPQQTAGNCQNVLRKLLTHPLYSNVCFGMALECDGLLLVGYGDVDRERDAEDIIPNM